MEWVQLYEKKSRPRIAEIEEYMNPMSFEAFQEFNTILRDRYGLGYVLPKYTKTFGWTYSYGRSGYILISKVVFSEDHFMVEDVIVHNKSELPMAIDRVDSMFHDGFLVRFAAFEEARTERRKKKAEAKKTGGKKQGDQELIYKKNCTWPAKVSRNDLKRLYLSNAKMMTDEELLDDIGCTICARCKESKEIYNLMEAWQIKCRFCGTIHYGPGVLSCSCGREYTYHSYRRSYREDNMPRGAASPLFDQFVIDWEGANTVEEKMRLIDNIIHECHVAIISGNKGRPTGINLIQGSKKQIIELIQELALG